MKRLPHIVGYHAKIRVLENGKVWTLMVDRPDWGSDVEILKELGEELGVKTVGEILREFKSKGLAKLETGLGLSIDSKLSLESLS